MIFIKKRIIPYILIFTLVFGVVAKPIKAEAALLEAGLVYAAGQAALIIGGVALTVLVANNADIIVDATTQTIDDIKSAVGGAIMKQYDSLNDDTKSFIDGVKASVLADPLHFLTNPLTITPTVFAALFNQVSQIFKSGSVELTYAESPQLVLSKDRLSQLTSEQTAAINSSAGTVFCSNADGYNYIFILHADSYYGVINESGKLNIYKADKTPVAGMIDYYYFIPSIGEWKFASQSYSGSQIGAMETCLDPAYFAAYGLHMVDAETWEELTREVAVTANGMDDTVTPTITADAALTEEQIDAIVSGTLAASDVYNITYEQTDGGATDTTTDYTGTLSGIWESIKAIPQTIIDGIISGIKSIFIPSETALQEIQDKRDEKLPILIELQSWGNDVGYMLAHPEEYASNLSFVVDFGKSDTYWDYGGSTTNMISLDWYFDYKEDVDELLVGFAWLVFLWNLFGQAASLISGASSAAYLDTRNTHVVNDRPKLPSRSSKRKGD